MEQSNIKTEQEAYQRMEEIFGEMTKEWGLAIKEKDPKLSIQHRKNVDELRTEYYSIKKRWRL